MTGNDTKRQRKERKPHGQPLASLPAGGWATFPTAERTGAQGPGSTPPGAATLLLSGGPCWTTQLSHTAVETTPAHGDDAQFKSSWGSS